MGGLGGVSAEIGQVKIVDFVDKFGEIIGDRTLKQNQIV